MSSRRLILSPLAQDDFRALLQFSEEQWGERQRDVYRAELQDRLLQLETFPKMGRPRDDIKRGIRGLLVGDYLFLYRVTSTTVNVLRIIHTRKDALDVIGL